MVSMISSVITFTILFQTIKKKLLLRDLTHKTIISHCTCTVKKYKKNEKINKYKQTHLTTSKYFFFQKKNKKIHILAATYNYIPNPSLHIAFIKSY